VIRITSIVLYVTYISLDVEAFHQSIGEVLFICWIFIYLLLVLRIEDGYARKRLSRTGAERTEVDVQQARVRPSRKTKDSSLRTPDEEK
jgi:hypothetical protein